MSKIEDKVLGKEQNVSKKENKKDIFSADKVWIVTRQGCGSNLVNGKMAYEMLGPDGKKKALKGNKKISDKGFIFERKN